MLTRLALSSNFFSSTLPTQIYALTGLTWLSFAQNAIEGELSPLLGQLTNLETFYAASNKLGGTIPVEFGLMPNITEIWLSSNKISGTLPESIGTWRKLTALYVDSNRLEGTIPTTISLLPLLEAFWATDNRLRGSVPMLPAILRPDDNGTYSCFLQFPNKTETNCFSSCIDARCVCGDMRCPFLVPLTSPPNAGTPAPASGVPASSAPTSAGDGAPSLITADSVLPIALGAAAAVLLVAIVIVCCCVVQRRKSSVDPLDPISVANSNYGAMPLPPTATSLPHSHSPASLSVTSSNSSLPTVWMPPHSFSDNFNNPSFPSSDRSFTPVTTYRAIGNSEQYQNLHLSPYASLDI